MRISVLKDDPGYRDDAMNWSVTLDGEKLDRCVTADDIAGIAVLMIVKPGPGTIDYETKTGAIRLFPPGQEPPPKPKPDFFAINRMFSS